VIRLSVILLVGALLAVTTLALLSALALLTADPESALHGMFRTLSPRHRSRPGTGLVRPWRYP
jgi:hypothetical protein